MTPRKSNDLILPSASISDFSDEKQIIMTPQSAQQSPTQTTVSAKPDQVSFDLLIPFGATSSAQSLHSLSTPSDTNAVEQPETGEQPTRSPRAPKKFPAANMVPSGAPVQSQGCIIESFSYITTSTIFW